MFKKILITLVAYLFLISNVYAAGSNEDSSSGSSSVKSNYDKACLLYTSPSPRD